MKNQVKDIYNKAKRGLSKVSDGIIPEERKEFLIGLFEGSFGEYLSTLLEDIGMTLSKIEFKGDMAFNLYLKLSTDNTHGNIPLNKVCTYLRDELADVGVKVMGFGGLNDTLVVKVNL